MPRYTVTDPTTNKSFDLEGDSPPSEQEVNDIFSQLYGEQKPQESSLLDKAVGVANVVNKPFQMMGKAVQDSGVMDNPAYEYSMPGMALKAQGMFQNTFNKAGEMAANKLTTDGANPYVAAAAGTALQMAPDVAMSAEPLLDTTKAMFRPSVITQAPKSFLRDYASEQTAKAAGARGVELSAENLPRTRQVGRLLKDTKIVGPINSSENMNTRLLNEQSKQGSMIDSVINQLDTAGLKGSSGRQLADKIRSIRSELVPPEVSNVEGTSYALKASKLEEAAKTAEAWGEQPLKFEQLRRLKQDLQGIANYDSESRALKIPKKAASEVRKGMESNVKSASAILGKPELSDQFLKANQNFNLLKDAEDWLSRQVGREKNASVFPLGDAGPVVEGALFGGTAGAGAGYAAKKFYDRIGNQMAAYGADALAPLADKIAGYSQAFKGAIKAGPTALNDLNEHLLKTDPEYGHLIRILMKSKAQKSLFRKAS